MKLPPHLQTVVDRMRPGVLCREGFLGDDDRPLPEILDSDDAEVESLGLSHERIAAELQKVLEAARGGFETPVRVGEHLVAVHREAMGPIPSPWSEGRVFSKGEVELTDEQSGRVFRFTPLSIHLIAAHGFYEGRGSRYRLEPAEIAEVLDIAGRRE
jgi:hypothetical protein